MEEIAYFNLRASQKKDGCIVLKHWEEGKQLGFCLSFRMFVPQKKVLFLKNTT